MGLGVEAKRTRRDCRDSLDHKTEKLPNTEIKRIHGRDRALRQSLVTQPSFEFDHATRP